MNRRTPVGNSNTPIRIDAELLDAAKHVGHRQSRSAAQQIAHWARLGREVEASRMISVHAVNSVLEGHASYDDLPAEDQAVVRAAWTDGLDAVAEGFDLAAEFVAAGRAHWIDIAPDGTVVRRDLESRS
jgi:hypothetical protein